MPSFNKKGCVPWNKGLKGFGKGKTISDDHKKVLREGQKGEKGFWYGKKASIETRRKLSLLRSGPNSPNWKGGISKNNRQRLYNLDYRLWREAVFKRDNFTCVWCGDNKGGNLEADHIKPWSLFPELRFDINNGRCLCKSCHKKTKTYGKKVTRLNYENE